MSESLAGSLPGLTHDFACLPDVDRIRAGLDRRSVAVGGMVGGSPALLLAALEPAFTAGALVVAPGDDEARALARDLAYFLGGDDRVALFPGFDAAHAARRARETDALSDRTRVLESLATDSATPYLVASLKAVLQPVPPPDALRRACFRVRMGESLDRDALGRQLAAAGFARVPLAEAPGEWSVRGGIIDVFPRGRPHPLRIELFGDEVESLRYFDPLSQRSVESVSDAVVPILSEKLSAGFAPTDDDAERRKAIRKASLLVDLLPREAVVVHVEEGAGAEWLARFERSRPEEELGTLYARFTLRSTELRSLRLSSAPVTPGPGASNLRLLSTTALARDLVTFGDAVESLLEANDSVRLLCPSDGERSRIDTLLAEVGLGTEPRLTVATGRLTHGFQVPALRTALLSYDELFGRTRLLVGGRKSRRTSTTPEWTDLRIGDPVVHLDHGIGIYRGLTQREQEGRSSDHLKLEFQGGTILYVPVTKSSLVHRYVGSGEAKPRLSKIGGKTWENRKLAVAQAAEGSAQELLRTQAMRQARPGIPAPPDGPEQLEFEATFPFELTEDQESALVALKADMEKDIPMDRLVCGDVGFGKTELAVRAAFKTVLAGRQAAVLVPTTVLAEQHGAVFEERYAGYPINVAVLSRFRTKREQREILEQAQEGRVDVVIGTHRLVSGDVRFKNLGLLVIDEEQRFGVRAKEALRQYRTEVDVITLTATPIPRTLHMALLGLRDISSLTVAPQGRRAIRTRVITPDDPEVRVAFLRELERGGQVFFIHNRVKSIEMVAAKVRHAVPEARVAVVHGQMSHLLVEERMHAFVEHRLDVLVATTIVESGLDIPNANTILIDRADLLGLADLHQLRGRVGRYMRRAYCYLIVQPGTMATDAERRVRAIEEHSELGAGFRIAMRDLEIRGAGNLLGAEQSGHIAAVGYELYCQLLADAVRRVRKDRVPFRTSCHVNLPAQTTIPPEYIPDDRQRIQLYRRLSCAANRKEVAAGLEDARDRFGRPPPELDLLAILARIRIEGERLGVTRIALIEHDGEERVLLRCVEPTRVQRALGRLGKRLRVVDKRHCHLLLSKQGLDGVGLAKAVLSALDRAPRR